VKQRQAEADELFMEIYPLFNNKTNNLIPQKQREDK